MAYEPRSIALAYSKFQPTPADHNARHDEPEQSHAGKETNERPSRYEHVQECNGTHQNSSNGQPEAYDDQLIPAM